MCDVDGVDEDVELEGIDGSCNSSDADNKMKIVMLNMVLEVRMKRREVGMMINRG